MLGMNPQDLQPHPGTYSRATVDDKDGLRTSSATSASQVVYGAGGTAFNGLESTLKTAGMRVAPRTVTITTGASVGTYRTGAGFPIVVTGTVNGVAATENLLLTASGGNETIRGALVFDDPTLCVFTIPGQVDANGTFQVGVGDICGSFRSVKGHAAGTIVMLGDDGKYDPLPVAAHAPEIVGGKRVIAAAIAAFTTDVGVTVYA